MDNKNRIRRQIFSSNYYNQYHLRYFLQLEKELETISNYVEFDKKNFKTFSLEILKLYQTVCSQIDAIAKVIAFLLDDSFDYNGRNIGINKWWFKIQNEYLLNDSRRNLQNFEILFNDDIVFTPFKKFKYELTEKDHLKLMPNMKTPRWWIHYNKVKHGRPFFTSDSNKTNFTFANLENLLNSFSALFILTFLYEDKIKYDTNLSITLKSKFFKIIE